MNDRMQGFYNALTDSPDSAYMYMIHHSESFTHFELVDIIAGLLNGCDRIDSESNDSHGTMVCACAADWIFND